MTRSATSRLAAWRAANGLSLREVGDLTGLDHSMISRVERGQRQLAPMTRVKVARRLGVDVADLFEVSDA